MKKIVLASFLISTFFVLLSAFENQHSSKSSLLVLGIAQDAGYPQIACDKECCRHLKTHPEKAAYPSSLALIDYENKKWWLIEATPDITEQIALFNKLTLGEFPKLPEGIILSHAHIGHYAGLMYLGKEALGAKGIKVYCLPRMSAYLKSNGPWSQLVHDGNIELNTLSEFQKINLSDHLSAELFTVPHRDEYSETAGMKFLIDNKRFLFIPDIDKWGRWNTPIDSLVHQSDFAFLDATFYSDGELGNRDMSQIPHPFVTETMKLFKEASTVDKAKIHFIHFNHSNPLLWKDSLQVQFDSSGFNRARQGKFYP